MSVEQWSSYAPGGLVSGDMKIDWWLINGPAYGGGIIYYCPYCGIKLTTSS